MGCTAKGKDHRLEGLKAIIETDSVVRDSTATVIVLEPGRAESVLLMEFTTSRVKAPQARRTCASSIEIFTQPKTSSPKRGSMSSLSMSVRIFGWPPVRLRHEQGVVGKMISLISSPSEHLATWPYQWSLIWASCTSILFHS